MTTLNENITILGNSPIVNSKASETYVSVTFRYGDIVWEGYVPIEYRRTGTAIDFDDMHGIQEQLAARILETAEFMDGRVRYVREPGAKTPTYAHQDDAGMDLYASKGNYIPAGGRCTFPTGIHIEIPKGYFGAIRAKSGLLRNYGIICSGTIDVGYTGEIMVTLVNTSDEMYCVSEGNKIAQLIVIPYERVELVEVESLEKTERGDNGFGSSGR